MRARADRSVLLVVDVQERLLPQIHEGAAVVTACESLLRAAAIFGVPALACEQYPQGLGRTDAALAALLDAEAIFPKLSFSAAADPALRARLDARPDAAVVICGTEAHVCVMQTALELRVAGRDVFVVADAVGSRRPASVELALPRLRQAGVQVVTVEMLLFEWAEFAGTDLFRTMAPLVR
jgi:nicotinamidase-related amidase